MKYDGSRIERKNRAQWDHTMKTIKMYKAYKEGKTIKELSNEYSMQPKMVRKMIKHRKRIEKLKLKGTL